MLSEDWIYKNIFSLSDKEIDTEKQSIVDDLKQVWRKTQIEDEGTDPAKEPQQMSPDDDMEEDADNPVGRPPEGVKYGQQDHVNGSDPLGDKTRKRDIKNRDRSITHTYRESLRTLKKQKSMLSENNLIDDGSLK